MARNKPKKRKTDDSVPNSPNADVSKCCRCAKIIVDDDFVKCGKCSNVMCHDCIRPPGLDNSAWDAFLKSGNFQAVCKTNCKSVDVNALSATVARLEKIVADLSIRLNSFDRNPNISVPTATAPALPAFDDFMNQFVRAQRELSERETRRANAVIFNVPDSGLVVPVDKRGDEIANTELKLIRDAVSEVQGAEIVSIKSVHRMGTFHESEDETPARQRPLKVECENIESKQFLLKHSNAIADKLRGDSPSKVFIRHDLSAHQRRQRKAVVDVLTKIRNAVPDEEQKNYVMRDFDGASKIVRKRPDSDSNSLEDVYVGGLFVGGYINQFSHLLI